MVQTCTAAARTAAPVRKLITLVAKHAAFLAYGPLHHTRTGVLKSQQPKLSHIAWHAEARAAHRDGCSAHARSSLPSQPAVHCSPLWLVAGMAPRMIAACRIKHQIQGLQWPVANICIRKQGNEASQSSLAAGVPRRAGKTACGKH